MTRFILAAWCGLVLGCSCRHEPVPDADVYHGEQARRLIFGNGNAESAGAALRAHITECYFFRSGSFSGDIVYWSFECDSADACWAALSALGGPSKSECIEW